MQPILGRHAQCLNHNSSLSKFEKEYSVQDVTVHIDPSDQTGLNKTHRNHENQSYTDNR